MATVSLKLPESLLREIEQEAATRGVPKSAVIRDSLERMLRKGRKAKKRLSCLDLMGDLVGPLRRTTGPLHEQAVSDGSHPGRR